MVLIIQNNRFRYGKTSLNINLNPGKYLANIYFLGNDEYLKGNTSANVEVLSTIVSRATFRYENGEILKNTYVKFIVNC